ncbi:Fc.00g029960.m01.CDS01 [Cosmosporella sp. VM-42]
MPWLGHGRRARRRSYGIGPTLPSPTDSGYGSFESSPEASPRLKVRTVPAFDGSGSRDVDTALSPLPQNRGNFRQVSHGAIWSVGGLAPGTTAVDDGQGHLLQSGTNARIFTTTFCTVKPSTRDDLEKHEGRVASALDIDPSRRILEFDLKQSQSTPIRRGGKMRDENKTAWDGYQWVGKMHTLKPLKPAVLRILPAAPFKILDAPNLRDDFYCTPLAYSPTCQILVVGLGNVVYAWCEETGTRPIHGTLTQDTWLTSVAFSSAQGTKAVLGIGRSDGSLVLKSMYDGLPRFDVQQPYPIACISWRPISTLRPSKNPLNPGVPVQTEDLVVGDEFGTIYYYVVEWPMGWEVSRDTWPGSMTLVAKISIHSQQICGLAWSPNGNLFASGGNDNLCCLFEVDHILGECQTGLHRQENTRQPRVDLESGGNAEIGVSRDLNYIPMQGANMSATENGTEIQTVRTSPDSMRNLGTGAEKHCWIHSAAVKAIAFCPWRHGLVATGGGSNDKCIHFFHTSSGAALATISVAAQVTSLIWSTTRREIAATFGYAQPDHPYRIAIFSWPDCRQVAAVP